MGTLVMSTGIAHMLYDGINKRANMKATWNGAVIAESDATVTIEGDEYFPPESVGREYLVPSDKSTTDPWKGECTYYTLMVEGEENQDAAWIYEQPLPDAAALAGADFTDYVAFGRGVKVTY